MPPKQKATQDLNEAEREIIGSLVLPETQNISALAEAINALVNKKAKTITLVKNEQTAVRASLLPDLLPFHPSDSTSTLERFFTTALFKFLAVDIEPKQIDSPATLLLAMVSWQAVGLTLTQLQPGVLLSHTYNVAKVLKQSCYGSAIAYHHAIAFQTKALIDEKREYLDFLTTYQSSIYLENKLVQKQKIVESKVYQPKKPYRHNNNPRNQYQKPFGYNYSSNANNNSINKTITKEKKE